MPSDITDGNGFEEWPTLDIKRPSQGAILYASNGKIAAYMGLDGTMQFMPNMSEDMIVSWEALGVYNPAEQQQLASKVDAMIDALAKKYGTYTPPQSVD